MKKGQAMLVAILIIFTAAIAIGLAAASIALGTTFTTSNQKMANQSYDLAAAAIDNTLMRMTKGDFSEPAPLSQGGTSCTIDISGSPNYQILAVCETTSPLTGTKKITKKIQADVTINNDITTVNSYQEIY